MSAIKDLPDLTVPPKKNNLRMYVTSYKVAVNIFIAEYIRIRQAAKKTLQTEGYTTMGPKPRGDFCSLALKLIQSPDLEYDELLELMTNGKYTVLPDLLRNFKNSMKDVHEEGTGGIIDLADFYEEIVKAPTLNSVTNLHFNRTSVIGFYVRRFLLSMDSYLYSELTSIHENFKLYYYRGCLRMKNMSVEPVKLEPISICLENLSPNLDESKKVTVNDELNHFSKRQAELFVSTQAALIEANEAAALPPPELQERIRNLLKNNPDLAEAHFLSYLNCLRVKEFCGAIDSMYNSFDRNTTLVDQKNQNADIEKVKGYRYAVLNLAILHAQFGHEKEAIVALKEAIMKAHDANDNVCLQHALSWLLHLTNRNKETLIERSIFKSSELTLSYNMSLGIQSFCQFAGLSGSKPASVFEVMTKSDVLNCQHSLIDLLSNSFSQKSALWVMYGKFDMASLWSQLLLHLKTDHLTRDAINYNGEGTCQAICNVGNVFIRYGKYQFAAVVFNHARSRFPNQPLSLVWMLNEKLLNFTQALRNGLWHTASSAATEIAAIDHWESQLRMSELFAEKGDYTSAIRYAYNVVSHYTNNSEEHLAASRHVRALTLIAQAQCAAITENSNEFVILNTLNKASSIASQYHLQYLEAIVQLHSANVQLIMGMPLHALNLLEKAILTITAHGCIYDIARAMLLYVKCKVAVIADHPEKERSKMIFELANLLFKVKTDFESVEAHSRVKDVLFLQAKLFHEVKHFVKRNQCALDLRLYNERYPSAVQGTTLLTSV